LNEHSRDKNKEENYCYRYNYNNFYFGELNYKILTFNKFYSFLLYEKKKIIIDQFFVFLSFENKLILSLERQGILNY